MSLVMSGPLYCNGCVIGKLHYIGLIICLKRNNVIFFVFGIDELKNTDDFTIMCLEWKGEHRLGTITGNFIIRMIKRIRHSIIQMIHIINVQHFPGIRHISRDRLIIHRNGECRIDEFFSGRQFFLFCLILCVSEPQCIIFFKIN